MIDNKDQKFAVPEFDGAGRESESKQSENRPAEPKRPLDDLLDPKKADTLVPLLSGKRQKAYIQAFKSQYKALGHTLNKEEVLEKSHTGETDAAGLGDGSIAAGVEGEEPSTDEHTHTEDTSDPRVPSKRRRDALYMMLKQRRLYRATLISVVVVMILIVAASVVLACVYMPVVRITAGGMEPLYKTGDFLVLWSKKEYERGDLCVFEWDGKLLLKRIIAIPGDSVDIDKDGNVYINGQQLDEPYLIEKASGDMTVKFPLTVPDGTLFIMGDNRETSIDSRHIEIGNVDINSPIGKVLMRVFPFGKR